MNWLDGQYNPDGFAVEFIFDLELTSTEALVQAFKNLVEALHNLWYNHDISRQTFFERWLQ